MRDTGLWGLLGLSRGRGGEQSLKCWAKLRRRLQPARASRLLHPALAHYNISQAASLQQLLPHSAPQEG